MRTFVFSCKSSYFDDIYYQEFSIDDDFSDMQKYANEHANDEHCDFDYDETIDDCIEQAFNKILSDIIDEIKLTAQCNEI